MSVCFRHGISHLFFHFSRKKCSTKVSQPPYVTVQRQRVTENGVATISRPSAATVSTINFQHPENGTTEKTNDDQNHPDAGEKVTYHEIQEAVGARELDDHGYAEINRDTSQAAASQINSHHLNNRTGIGISENQYSAAYAEIGEPTDQNQEPTVKFIAGDSIMVDNSCYIPYADEGEGWETNKIYNVD